MQANNGMNDRDLCQEPKEQLIGRLREWVYERSEHGAECKATEIQFRSDSFPLLGEESASKVAAWKSMVRENNAFHAVSLTSSRARSVVASDPRPR
jgi:hypothetical protein